MSTTCPACNDNNTQRLSVAYEAGISDVNASTSGSGIGFGRGGIGVGFGSSTTHGTAQTALSQRAAPPSKISYLRIMKYWFISLLVVPIILLIVGMPERTQDYAAYGISIITAVLLLRAFTYNNNEWPQLFQKWNQSYICLHCGNIFEE